MREPIVAANWKMNGTRDGVDALVSSLVQVGPNCNCVICPPSVFLSQVGALVDGTSINVGAQNLDWHESGAYTGELSAEMLLEFGCRYAIVGHSERRNLFNETDEQVAMKFKACLRVGLKPILCVGETLKQRQAGDTGRIVEQQIMAVLDKNGIEGFSSAVIAYEPIWAIGTGETALPEQAEAVHVAIREILAEKDLDIAENIQIIYGGSVNEKNAAELFAQQNIDGALVGGASLKAETFLTICAATQK